MTNEKSGFFCRRTLSGYMRIVSSGASTVASTVCSAGASVASSVADRNGDSGRDQVHWAGFDKLECEGGGLRQVLLLAYRSGFQVWDVEEGDDVHQLVARYDVSVSSLQIQKKPIASKSCQDKFANVRPLLVVALDQSVSFGGKNTAGTGSPCNGTVGNSQDRSTDNLSPTFVRFYSLRSHEYVHFVKFSSPVYSIRCSSRVVAISQASQIHCFDAGTLEKEYTIVTCPIVPVSLGSGGIGCGPLALAPRWLAYSGTPVKVSSSGRVSPQHLAPATGFLPSPPNGSLVAYYAKESSKRLAAGIASLGDVGYKTLTKYCSELIPDNNSSMKHWYPNLKTDGTINGDLSDVENAGMVIVRDIVSKSIVAQFKAHKSPISALDFDPSGMLLVTASVHGHNINVFRIFPCFSGSSSGSDVTATCVHLYRLQRGITNAVIQDISFSVDSQWVMISSSRGTSHLFSISPFGGVGDQKSNDVHYKNGSYGSVTTGSAAQWPHSSASSKTNHQTLFPSGTPITLSVAGRIKNGNNGWKGVVSGAAAVATGRVGPLSGPVSSVFHSCKDSGFFQEMSPSMKKYYLLVFSPSGWVIQYVLRYSIEEESGIDLSGLGLVSHRSLRETDTKLVVEALQKWDLCHKRNRRDRGDNIDVYGHASGESTKVFKKGTKKGSGIYPEINGSDTKVKATVEENNHMYISEVELQMNTAQVPVWAKSKLEFQMMVGENIFNDNAIGGEIMVERVPFRTIEARTKDLVPVFGNLQGPRFQQPRSNCLGSNMRNSFGSNRAELLIRQKSDISEDRRHSCRSNCSPLDCGPESAAANELPSDINGSCWGDFRPSSGVNMGFIDNKVSTSMKNQVESLNTREGLKMETQLEHVNGEKSPGMEKHFQGYKDHIDDTEKSPGMEKHFQGYKDDIDDTEKSPGIENPGIEKHFQGYKDDIDDTEKSPGIEKHFQGYKDDIDDTD